ncbi:hypothetical protein [Amycolatopsis echigonensis]|uniref:Uncharacterized protein n=1 Tax=Amycolatopsis echigonensis TaxID=2576905 RepID=A0A8E2B737_9PSEU|nr:hypothetical protein [Amycolatopsis echigonensis]MBB2504329.1 hypothetical protein [Amycolatopsis echigonensis]
MTTADDDFRYLFGRLETKIDAMDEKLDHTAEKLGRHEERILAVERDVRDLKVARTADQQQTTNGVSGMRIAVVSALIAAGFGGLFLLIQILTHAN